MRDEPNVNALWGALLIEELVRRGVKHFVVAPGSRSAPLVRAAALHDGAHVTIRIDERGAAYHALGIARGGGAFGAVPAAVITTSGTAVANLLPAAVEAHMDNVPLVLITADRPPELHGCGANQTIRQRGIFGSFVRAAYDLPCPDDGIPARTLLETVDQAWNALRGAPLPGPVHLNMPFREPLAPEPTAWDRGCLTGLDAWLAGHEPFVRVATKAERPRASVPSPLVEQLGSIERGLVVFGSVSDRDAGRLSGESVRELVRELGWPCVTDIRSQARLANEDAEHLPHLDRVLGRDVLDFEPDVVLQFGGRLTSKRLQQYLDATPFERYVLVDPDANHLDPGGRVTDSVEVPAWTFCDAATKALPAKRERPDLAPLRDANDRIEAALDAAIEDGEVLSEPYVARWLTRNMRADDGFVLSSSMPVRDVQSYAVSNGPRLRVASNRGASGIDGVVSTAAGFADGLKRPTTLLIGDLALLHDVNALGCLRYLDQPVTIVVLNNGGGSIFSFLPIAAHEEIFSPYFTTPHELSFEGAAAMFDLRYFRVDDRATFEDAYRTAHGLKGRALIEVRSSLEQNKAEHDRIEAAVERAVARQAS